MAKRTSLAALLAELVVILRIDTVTGLVWRLTSTTTAGNNDTAWQPVALRDHEFYTFITTNAAQRALAPSSAAK